MSGIVGKNLGRGSGVVTATPVGADVVSGANLADDACNSEHYTDGSVDLVHLQTGTDGQIISWDASGDPVALGPGSDGEVLTSTGAGSPPAFEAAGGGGFTQGSEQATTSGTSITFGSIPTGVQMVIVNVSGVSGNLGGAMHVQIGDSGGVETSGYLGDPITINHAAANVGTELGGTKWVSMHAETSDISYGTFILTLEDATNNTWICTAMSHLTTNNDYSINAGNKTLSGELTQVLYSNGSGTFDAGAVNIMYL